MKNKLNDKTIINGQMSAWIVAYAAVIVLLCGCGRLGNTNDEKTLLSKINNDLQLTNCILSYQIDQNYDAFYNLYFYESEQVDPYKEKALTLREEATELVDYIEALKWDLVIKCEDKDAETSLLEGLLKSTDTLRNGRKIYNINSFMVKTGAREASSFMLNKGKAVELASKIQFFCDEVTKIIDSEYIHEIGLDTDENWANDVFKNRTSAEDVVILNDLITKVQMIELTGITHLLSEIRANGYTFDEIGAKVFAESNYLQSGQIYRAQVILTAWKNTQTMAYVKLDGGAEKVYTSDGRGVINLEFNCGVGQHKYTGSIKMLDPTTGELKDFPFENSFTVSSPFSD